MQFLSNMDMLLSKIKIQTIIVTTSCLLWSTAKSQDFFAGGHLEDIIEEIAASTDLDLDYSSLFSALEDYYYYPLNLNSADKSELQNLLFLTDFQIHNILRYRERNNGFRTIYELQFVASLDMLSIKRMLAFVTVADYTKPEKLSISDAAKYGRSDLFIRYQRLLQERAGYKIPEDSDRSRYLGSPDKLYTRYAHRYRNQVFWGITAEKDDGEQFFRNAQKYGFDFYSAHVQINDIGRINKLIIGDFSAEFGQGLTLWTGMSFGKTASAMNISKRARGVHRYTSVNENDFFRGAAISLNFGKFDVTQFISYNYIDAAIRTDSINGDVKEYISSFPKTGLHRTPTEIRNRKSVSEFVSGANVSFNSTYGRLGATAVYTDFSLPYLPADVPYRHFEFRGKSNANFGLDYATGFRSARFFGEFSMSQNQAYAFLNAAIFDLAPQLKMSILHRYFKPNYHALYAQPFSEGNRAFNENGIYMGFEIHPIRNWRIDAYIDSWEHPWLRYGINAPSKGMEYLVQVNYFPSSNLILYYRTKIETKQRNNPEYEIYNTVLSDVVTARHRFHINFSPNDSWRLQNRVELSNYRINSHSEWGYLIYQDLQYRFLKIPLIITARLAMYDTESWNTRIYAYEPDVLYAFSIPAYYCQGIRKALVIRYSILEELDIWVKIANSFFNNQDGLGTGLDYIEGKNRTDFKIQLRYRF